MLYFPNFIFGLALYMFLLYYLTLSIILHRNPCSCSRAVLCRRTNFIFWLGTLRVSGSPSAHHQEFNNCTFSTGTCHTGFEDSLQAASGWNCLLWRPQNVAQLRAHVVKLCRALSEDLCRKVVTNARVRLQEVVRQNGGHIEHVLH